MPSWLVLDALAARGLPANHDVCINISNQKTGLGDPPCCSGPPEAKVDIFVVGVSLEGLDSVVNKHFDEQRQMNDGGIWNLQSFVLDLDLGLGLLAVTASINLIKRAQLVSSRYSVHFSSIQFNASRMALWRFNGTHSCGHMSNFVRITRNTSPNYNIRGHVHILKKPVH